VDSESRVATRDRAMTSFLTGDRYRAARDFHRAAAAYRKGLRLWPESPQALVNCSMLLLATRRITAARKLLNHACRSFPAVAPLRSNLLLTSLYDPDLPPAEPSRLHLDWGLSVATRATSPMPPPQSRLRIGYLSANFCSNPEAFFSIPLLRNHDRGKFEIYLYSSSRISDEHTAYFASIADVFRPIGSKTDVEACRMIRSDGVHILVDLSGHFADGRLAILARKPAPLQLSFPTYPSTTGLAAVAYRISDNQTAPPSASDFLYSEKVIRLNRCFCCYQPPAAPLQTDLPARSNGYVTFGVFNRPAKISDRMLRLCARILARVPESRLLFHHTYNGDGRVSSAYRKPIERIFHHADVDPRRLLFVGGLPLLERLQCIAQADIALDTFPYNGMTTTCECYLMGVPLVALEGVAHVSRVGVSLTAAMRLEDWIARSENGYVDLAVTKAGDLGSLGRLRSVLRKRMLASSLTDGPGYAQAIEQIYSEIWKGHAGVWH
jgi:protein O-GlcNAc transferase